MLMTSTTETSKLLKQGYRNNKLRETFSKFYNSNSMFLSFFSAILIGPLVKLNGFYTSIKTYAYEYVISALISQCYKRTLHKTSNPSDK